MEIKVLESRVLFDFIIGGSTGEVTTGGDDFIRHVGKMLPVGAFSWVSKYRTAAKRECLKYGAARKVDNRTRGYFVHTDYAEIVSKAIKDLRDAFIKERDDFLVGYPKRVEDWANDPKNQVVTNGGVTRADLIRKHAPSADDLRHVLTFGMSANDVRPTKYFGEDDALNTEIKGLAGQAAIEIADDVKRSWKGPVGGRTSSRVLGLVRRIRSKAKAIEDLSPKFESLREMCDQVLAQTPTEGTIEGAAFIQVSALLTFCSTAANILADQSIAFESTSAAEQPELDEPSDGGDQPAMELDFMPSPEPAAAGDSKASQSEDATVNDAVAPAMNQPVEAAPQEDESFVLVI